MSYFTTGYFGLDNLITAGDTLRQQIFDTVVARLQTILIANGYKTNAGNNVLPWEQFGVDDDRLPALRVLDDGVAKVDDTIGDVENHMNVVVGAFSTKGSTTTSPELAREMIADVIETVRLDPDWGGLAQDTRLIDEALDAEQMEKLGMTAGLVMTIIFTTERHATA